MAQTTKRTIAASLLKLLERKPLSKITVTDLAADCEISRHTFYYHFQDIYDLVDWIWQEDARTLLEGKSGCDNWHEGMASVFQYLMDHKALVRNTIRSVDREHLTDDLCDMTYQLIYHIIEEQSAGRSISAYYKAFIAKFYAHGLVGISMDWIEGGMKEEPEAMMKDLALMIQDEFQDAVEKFSR